MTMTADLIITGKIITATTDETATMLAVKDKSICFIGDQEEIEKYRGNETKIIHLEEGCVMPGMVDGHAHPSSGVILFQGVNLYHLNSIEEYSKAIHDYIQKYPQKQYIQGRGFINSHFGQMGPSAEFLDENYPEKFFYLESEDCHSCLVNSKVLQLAGINKDTTDLENGVIVRDSKSGNPTGWLKEKEMGRAKKIYPQTTIEEYKDTILQFQKQSMKYGITAVYEPILDDDGDFQNRIEAYSQLDQENLLYMDFRLGVTIDPTHGIKTLDKIATLQKTKSGKHFGMMGIKVFIDGVVEGHTAFLREPYSDSENDCGCNMWSQEVLNQVMVQAASMDMPVHVHAIGDAAMDSALDGFEASFTICQSKDLRNCITHLQIVKEEHINRMKQFNIIAVTNPFWHFKNPDYFKELEVPFLGRQRAEKEYPMKSFFQKQLVVTQASDWPVSFSNNPFISMEIAVTRREVGNSSMEPLNEKEAVKIQDMIMAATINGAFQLKLENELGTLEVGKRANFIIIDSDFSNIKNNQIAKIKVIGNFFDGINQLEGNRF
jgi:predicted amidohydrolase YtcJ